MCEFFSAIVTKNKILWDLDIDSHEDLVKKFKLKDDTAHPDFVRVEMTPTDGNIFNHDLNNWKLHKDQDYMPVWFNLEEAEIEIRKYIVVVFRERFVIEQTIKEIKEGRWYVSGGTIQHVSGGTIQHVSGGTIQDVRGGTIQHVRGGTIQNVWGGTIQNVWGGTIQDVRGGTIQHVWGGTIQSVWGGTIQHVRGGTIQHVRGGTIQNVWGGTIQSVWGGTIQIYSSNAKWEKLSGSGIVILRHENKIIVAEKGWKLKKSK